MTAISQSGYLFGMIFINAAFICFMFYILFIFFCIYTAMLLKISKISNNFGQPSKMYISTKKLIQLLVIYTIITALIIKSTIVISGTLMYGHFLITTTSYRLSIFIIFFIIFILIALLKHDYINNKNAVEIVLVCILLIICMLLMCMSGTYYAILFNLDCLNMLLFFIIFCSTNINTIDYHNKLIGVSAMFWIAFISTIFLLIGGIYAIKSYHTANLLTACIIDYFFIVNCTAGSLLYNNIFFIFFILGVFLKLGVGPLFVWKKYLFNALSSSALYIYMFIYFSITFILLLNIILPLLIASLSICKILFTVVILFGVFIIKASIDFGMKLSDFFVYSTALNVLFVVCFVLSTACCICL